MPAREVLLQMQHSNDKLSRAHVGKDPNVCSRARKSARSSVGRYADAEKCHPRASRRLAFREAGKSQLFTPVRQSFAEWRLKFALVGQLRRGGCGQVRRRHTGQGLGNEGRIEVFDGAVGEAGPDLIHSQKRYPKVTAEGEPLAIWADRHHGAVHGAVARVENVAILVSQSAAFHVPDERDAEYRRISAVIHAFGADRIELVLGPRKYLGDGTLIDALVLDEQKPAYRLASFVQLLPQTRGGGLRQLLSVQRRGVQRSGRCQNQYRQFCSQGRKSSAIMTCRANRLTPPIIWLFHEQRACHRAEPASSGSAAPTLNRAIRCHRNALLTSALTLGNSIAIRPIAPERQYGFSFWLGQEPSCGARLADRF